MAGDLIIAFADWSPNGRRIVMGAVTFNGDRRFHLYALKKSGGALQELSGEVATQPPAWSPDGDLIAFANAEGDRVEAMRTDGSGRRTLAKLRGAQIRNLSWSPDSSKIAFTAAKKPPED